MTEEEDSDLKNYDPTQDDVVADIFYRKGNNKNGNKPVDPFSSQANPKVKSAEPDETGISNVQISVPRPMVSPQRICHTFSAAKFGDLVYQIWLLLM